MRVIVQRVHYCKLTSEDVSSEIGNGLLVTVGASMQDTNADIEYLASKIARLRIFKDEEGKCNLSLLDVGGDVMVVSNFTLQARIGSGTRPDFSSSGDPARALELYEGLIENFKRLGINNVAQGNFKHHMHLDCQLDGPFNLILESEGR